MIAADEDEENDLRHKLTVDEERLWKKTKGEPNTREDWEDLNMTLVAYKRRRIARHAGGSR